MQDDFFNNVQAMLSLMDQEIKWIFFEDPNGLQVNLEKAHTVYALPADYALARPYHETDYLIPPTFNIQCAYDSKDPYDLVALSELERQMVMRMAANVNQIKYTLASKGFNGHTCYVALVEDTKSLSFDDNQLRVSVDAAFLLL